MIQNWKKGKNVTNVSSFNRFLINKCIYSSSYDSFKLEDWNACTSSMYIEWKNNIPCLIISLQN